MRATTFIAEPDIFLRHTADLCFIGQDVIEMRPGELWLFTRYGRPPTNFAGNRGQFTDPIILKSRDGGRTWGEPTPMGLPWSIDGFMSDGGTSVFRMRSGKVLFISHRNGSTYRHCGSHGLAAISESADDGRTWSPARLLTDEPEDIQYLMNQRLIQLTSGRLVLPTCARDPRIPLETFGEGAHPTVGLCYLSDDDGRTWRRSRGQVQQRTDRGVQEPVVGEYAPNQLVMIYRSGLGCHQASFSEDGGETWSAPEDTPLTAACSPLTMTKLADGRLFLVYNHAVPLFKESYYPRNPLVYATSRDGRTWSEPVLIDDQPGQQLIYPSITPTAEGLLVVYCAHYDAGDGGFNFPPDYWQTGGGKRCILPLPPQGVLMKSSSYYEPAREIPVLGEYDVVVCGGGPAGCAAAIAAARHGAKTLLVEKDGYLGGATVSQLVSVILSTNGMDFQGVWHEYARGLRKRGGLCELEGFGSGQIRGAVDPEMVKYVWDELLTAAGAEQLLHAWGANAIVEDGVCRGVLLETRAGRRAILAQRVIDTTGDGAVAAAAGVPWEQGDDQGHPWAMSCTKVFRMGNVRWPDHPNTEAMARFEAEVKAAVARGEYTSPILTQTERVPQYVRAGLWRLTDRRTEFLSVMSRVLKVNPLDPFDFTRAEREGRQQAWECADACRRFAPGFEQAYLLDTSAQIGLRSSRRLRGRATVTAQDALEFRKYPDGIARSSWDIDVWPADSYTAAAVDHSSDFHKQRHVRLDAGDYFDIRYGCLVAAGVDNLLMAGRCLSAEHIAESSLRIQQTCIATGEAAGVAAALSLQAGVTPADLDPQQLVAQLTLDRDIEPAFAELDFKRRSPVCP